jgi:type I restriction enzyme S subunit
MKGAWTRKPFEHCIEPVVWTQKVQRKDYLAAGKYPIISQEADFVNGYWDRDSDVFRVSRPLVLFGDHTQVLKYIDFDFVLGADGVKILRPKSFLCPKFFFYQLQAVEFPSLGYARHYRLLKEVEISFPPLLDQQRIVALLDEAFEGLATAKANVERNLQNARAIYASHLQAVFSQPGEGWTEKEIKEICTLINGRAYKKDEMLGAGKYPLLRVGNFFSNRDWYYSDLELDASKYCDKGDLLYAWSASFGPQIWEGEKVIYHYHIWKVLPKESVVDKRFLLYLLEWDVDQIKLAHGTGATMMHVSKGSMESRLVPIPSLHLQSDIVFQLDGLRVETQYLTRLYERKLSALEELKTSLLQQAFSGEL